MRIGQIGERLQCDANLAFTLKDERPKDDAGTQT
jgi:hypothetical protein